MAHRSRVRLEVGFALRESTVLDAAGSGTLKADVAEDPADSEEMKTGPTGDG